MRIWLASVALVLAMAATLCAPLIAARLAPRIAAFLALGSDSAYWTACKTPADQLTREICDLSTPSTLERSP